ncbi:DUF3667 domain-containing protein [Algoriphagus marinus]|uniref:DUF3667 domain-containing protein n=1 Tax=Algoriphagus marinus TaxID=1925762 RepID=UPI00094B9B19|nr:DUF3667 domain-containing protein [Algoriphagus marinus]
MKLDDGSCMSCGSDFQGAFCHNCGEKRIALADKRVIHFLEEAFSSVFVADGKFFKTIKILVTDPGELTRSFVLGVRKKYLSPLQLFFFANLIYFIFPLISTFNTSLDVQMNRLPYSDSIRPVVENYLQKNEMSLDSFTSEFEKISSSNGKLLLIVLVVLQGFFLKTLFWKRQKLFLIDFLAGSSYFYGFYILFILVLLPASFILVMNLFGISGSTQINELSLTIIFLLVIVTYMFFLIRKAYDVSNLGSLWRSVLVTIFIVPSFIVYRYILFWVTFWMLS